MRAGTLSSAQRAGAVQPYPAAMIGAAYFIELSGILGRYFIDFAKPHSPGKQDTAWGPAGAARRGGGVAKLGHTGRVERLT